MLTKCVNKFIETGYFLDSLKLAKKSPVDKSNYRPVSILTSLSKGYEKAIYNQLSDYFNSFLNNMWSERHIARNMLCSNFFSHANKF